MDVDGFEINLPYNIEGKHDNRSSRVGYWGAWTHDTTYSGGAYQGSTSWTNVQEAGAVFTFIGDRLIYTFTRAYNRGIVAITIDGVDFGYVDAYSSDIRWQQTWVFYVGSGGTNRAIHNVNFTVTGRKNSSATNNYTDIDALEEVDEFSQPQVFGQRNTEYAGYLGISTYMTTPNPPITTGWAAGPNGVTDFISNFMEAGPTKDCNPGCGLHPYASWMTSGVFDERVDTSINLGAGLRYQYEVYYLSEGSWYARWCGGAGCYQLVLKYLSRTVPFQIVSSGGESSSGPIGTLQTDTERFKHGTHNVWYGWCYTTVHNTSNGGTISPCSATGWQVRYE